MRFNKAAKIFWKANPQFQLTVIFLAVFIGAVIWAGNVPLVITGLISTLIIVLSIGTYLNIKQIQERSEQNKRKDS